MTKSNGMKYNDINKMIGTEIVDVANKYLLSNSSVNKNFPPNSP